LGLLGQGRVENTLLPRQMLTGSAAADCSYLVKQFDHPVV
jgi:hypothetical protein